MSASRRFVPLLVGIGVLALVGFAVLASALGNQGSGLTAEQARGQSLFRTRCASCHATTTDPGVGPGLAGLFAPGGPTLPASVDYAGKLPNGEPITEASVGQFILNGGKGQIGAMPPVALAGDELQAVIAYLKTLAK